MNENKSIFEHGYFESISSGGLFQFFSSHFFSKCRMDMRVGAFDMSMSPTYGKNTELVFSIPKFFSSQSKVERIENF